MGNLQGKVAAIIGAASGIGLACAKALLAAGVRVVLIDRTRDRLAKACGDLGAGAMPLVVDLTPTARRRCCRGYWRWREAWTFSTAMPGPVLAAMG